MSIRKDFFHLTEKEKERAYCFLFVAVLIILLFGDQIIMQFIKKEPNENNTFFGSTEEKNYNIDFLNQLTVQELNQLISAKETFYVLFTRSNCEACERYLPTLKELKETYQLNIYYLDCDKVNQEEKETLQLLENSDQIIKNMEYTPYLISYQNGTIEADWIGKKDKQELEAYIIQNKN